MATAKKKPNAHSAASRAHEEQRRRLGKAAGGDVAAFIAGFPGPLRPLAEEVRRIVRGAAPGLQEAIKWGWPTFVVPGVNGLRGVICNLYLVRDEYLNLGFTQGRQPGRSWKGPARGSGT